MMSRNFIVDAPVKDIAVTVSTNADGYISKEITDDKTYNHIIMYMTKLS